MREAGGSVSSHASSAPGAPDESVVAELERAVHEPRRPRLASRVRHAVDRPIVRSVAARAASGAAGGCVGTVSMTAAMLGMQQLLPKREQYPLPPRRIVDRLAGRFGARRALDRGQLNALTAVAHFAYGTGAGAIYGPIGLALPLPRVVSGIAYGLVVWTASYLGLLPALGILRPATQHPAGRNALMIAAHVVWGATLGLVTPQVEGWIRWR